jgi:hypothetical protein
MALASEFDDQRPFLMEFAAFASDYVIQPRKTSDFGTSHGRSRVDVESVV